MSRQPLPLRLLRKASPSAKDPIGRLLNKNNLFSPEEDAFLSVQFGKRTLTKRKENKKHLAETLHIDTKKTNKPIVLILLSLFVNDQDREFLERMLEAMRFLDIHVVVVGKKSECEDVLLSLFIHREPTDKLLHEVLGGADIILLPPSCPTNFVRSVLQYGLIPVAFFEQTDLVDYDPVFERGNSFLYNYLSPWSAFASLVRALETHRLSYDWQRIQKNGMDT
ncbi:MAG: hypothetical protein A2V81_00845 [Candidatus Abawacabacteria bacterium RBG_16_42_10]|uniref:Glycosyl transferase family 1 domain-containing protein n=1 Tax=Candidatus Abawacabacteria bacterium RBG_16_42_10 TaxID=1817814 RepID=A0A1F4XHY6_9BACT|nr:MAG: hypothetical protein A2V81_00845 [Candidatus Abawacabacteria bacterium RBG_16_42_10]